MYIIQIFFVFVERERQMISYYENVTNDELQHTEIIFRKVMMMTFITVMTIFQIVSLRLFLIIIYTTFQKLI